MPGYFSRIKNWVAKEVLSYSDLNAEFNNIISNCQANKLGGYSVDVPQMQSQVNPGGVGSESRADTIAQELERLRYVIARVTGKTYWYEAPTRSLQTLYANANNYIIPSEPSAAGATYEEVISDFVSAGFIDQNNFLNSTFCSPSTKMSDTKWSLCNHSVFPSFFWQVPNGDLGKVHTISLWFKNFSPLNTIYFNLLAGTELYLNSSGYLELNQTFKQSTVNGTKLSSKITGTTNLALNSEFQNVIIRFDYTTGVSKVELLHNGTLVGTISQPLRTVNTPSSKNWPIIMGQRGSVSITEVLTNPNTDLPSSYGWTPTGTAGSTSGGILTLSPGGAAQSYYSKSVFSSIPSNGAFIETKYRLRNISNTLIDPTNGAPFEMYLRIDSVNVGFHVQINGNTIQFVSSAGGIASYSSNLLSVEHNSTDWTILTLKVTLATTYVYINGRLIGSFATPTSDTTAGDTLSFGKLVASPSSYADIDIEYLQCGNAFTGTDIIVPNVGFTQLVSDFCHVRSFIQDSTTINSLQNNSPFSIFGNRSDIRSYEYNRSNYYTGSALAANSTANIGEVGSFISDGKTPSKFLFKILVGQSAATAGTYSFGAYLEINCASVYGTNGGQQFISNPAGGGALGLYESMSQVIPATNVPNLMFPLRIDFAQVLPAGIYKVSARVNAATGNPGNLTIRSYKFTSFV